MEVLRVVVDRLLAPLEPGGEEPRERQYDPPQTRRHAEEVHQEELDGAERWARRFIADDLRVRAVLVTRDLLVAGEQADDVADADHGVAGAEEDDRPLWVAEPLHVDEVRCHGHEGRHAAECRPERDPELGEVSFVAAEVGSVA